MIAVILAGGFGKRMGNYTAENPKPMIQLDGKPVLQYQIENLREYGITEIVLVIGYKGEKIKSYFKDGSRLGVNIRYFEEKKPLGTAGAFYYLKDSLGDIFMVLYGDVIFNVDFSRFIDFHLRKKAICSMIVHPNDHPFDSDLILMNEDNLVQGILKKNDKRDFYYNNCVNSGLFLFCKDALKDIIRDKKQDLEKDVISGLISKGTVYGYKTTEYIKDMGTPERYCLVEEHIKDGLVSKLTLSNKQRAIFLDRDGTINKYKGLISKVDDIEVFEEAYKAIRLINNSQYIAIVITNQPVIARNLCTLEELADIHKKIESCLGEHNAYLDDIYYCPHHPDKGYPEENPAYKIECKCRKPNIGLIEKAIKKYNIDISNSYFIGDTTVDIQTGKNAKLKTVLLETGVAGHDKKYDVEPDFRARDIYEAVKLILDNDK